MTGNRFFKDSPSPEGRRSETSFDSTGIDEPTENQSFYANLVIELSEDPSVRLAQMSEMSGGFALEDRYMTIINDALASAAPELKEEIIQSQVCAVMKANFGEIFKNSLDAWSRRPAPKEFLHLSILIRIDKNKIAIAIADNAGGFREDFLSQLSETEKRLGYLDSKIRSEKTKLDGALGGRALGIRRLIAHVETGHDLVGTTEVLGDDGSPRSKAYFQYNYVKPAISTIDFRNSDDGAVVTVTMSRQPVIEAENRGDPVVEAEESDYDDVPVFLSPRLRGPK